MNFSVSRTDESHKTNPFFLKRVIFIEISLSMNLIFCSMDCGVFFNAFYVSVKLLILFSCVVFLISLNCLSVFSHSYLSFPQRAIFNSLSGKLKISTSLESVTGKLFCSFGGIIFP